VRNLFLLGNSAGTPYSTELLAHENLSRILEKALDRFHRVVIDTAPVAVVSDALHFVRLVPAVCFVVHAGHTPKRVSQRACRLLREAGGSAFVGVVLNQIRHGDAAAYYYHYYIRSGLTGGFASVPATG